MNIHARQAPPDMTVAEFLVWAASQPEGRYELVDGQTIAMAPERSRHALTKFAVHRALFTGIASAGLPCTVFPDGMTVAINERTAREPDAAVQCGAPPDPESMTLDAPLLVVEVLSQSTRRIDLGAKLAEYFSVPSIRHYLIVDPDARSVTHHIRDEFGAITATMVAAGAITFDPPGFSITCEQLFSDA